MTIPVRTICMLAAEVAVIAVFVITCGWFPVAMWQPWAMFFFCFGICFVLSFAVTLLKTRLEERKMEEALERLKRLGQSGAQSSSDEDKRK